MTNVDKATGEILEQIREVKAAHPARTKPTIQTELSRYQGRISELLAGTGVSAATFTAQIGNACRNQPKLLSCDPATVLGAALRCAQLGLAPNDPRNLAWIIPYGKEATFQIGYGGIMELARRAVPGLRFDGHTVYKGDYFDCDYGNVHQPLRHRPAVAVGSVRGDAYAWYARAIYPDGGSQVHVLDSEGVEYHRKFSKQPNGGMWKDSYDAAALKSVVMDMRRWLPSSAQLAVAVASDQAVIDVGSADDFDDVGAITHDPANDE